MPSKEVRYLVQSFYKDNRGSSRWTNEDDGWLDINDAFSEYYRLCKIYPTLSFRVVEQIQLAIYEPKN